MTSIDICTPIELPEQQSNELLGFEANDVYGLYVYYIISYHCSTKLSFNFCCMHANQQYDISVGVNYRTASDERAKAWERG